MFPRFVVNYQMWAPIMPAQADYNPASQAEPEFLKTDFKKRSENRGGLHMDTGLFSGRSIWRFILALTVLISLPACASQVLAQRTTASVAGSVTDESGATVPGAEVMARNLATALERSVTSNTLGYYVI